MAQNDEAERLAALVDAVWSEYEDSVKNKWPFRKEHVENAIRRRNATQAARIAELEAALERLDNETHELRGAYGCAAMFQERAEAAEAALAEAEARSAALVAGAYEAAAKWVESHRTQSVSAMATPEPCDKGYTHEGTKYAVQLRALTPDDATAALDRIKAEAEARGYARGLADADCRQWLYYPIEMPVTADGKGPATVGVDAAQITYEVWDRLLNAHASFDNLPDAINEAMRLNALAQKEAGAVKGGTISTGPHCDCGMIGPCMFEKCRHPLVTNNGEAGE